MSGFNTQPNAPITSNSTTVFVLTARVATEILPKSNARRKKISIINDSDNLCLLQVGSAATFDSYTVPLPARTAINSPAFLYENPGEQSITSLFSIICNTDFVVGVSAQGSVNLDAGASGSINGITIDGIEIMSGAVNFDTDLGTTATAVALNITNNTSAPNYTAVAAGALITITAPATGTNYNGLTVVSNVTTITTTDVNIGTATLGVSGDKILVTEFRS